MFSSGCAPGSSHLPCDHARLETSLRRVRGDEFTRPYQRPVAADLHAEGVTAIAHRAWNDPDGNGIDLILLAFTSAKGAEDRFYTTVSQTTTGLDERAVPLTGYPLGSVRAFVRRGLDSNNDVRAEVYACLPGSRVVLEAFSFSRARFGRADFVDWTRAQVDALR